MSALLIYDFTVPPHRPRMCHGLIDFLLSDLPAARCAEREARRHMRGREAMQEREEGRA